MCTSSTTGSMRNGDARKRCLWGRTGFVLFGMLVSLSMMGLEVKAGIVYVDPSATTGNDDGTSWDDAYLVLQNAIANTSSGNEIWVIEGTYLPDDCTSNCDDTDRESSFIMKNGVDLYGGFDGLETARSQRDVAVNVTILSGDLEDDDGTPFTNRTDNSFHVVTYNIADADVTLDGFTISGGHAHGDGIAQDQGAALHIRKDSFCDGGTHDGETCTVTDPDCYGAVNGTCVAADKCIAGGPTVKNCIFIDNSSDDHGAVNDHGLASSFADCTFKDNIAAKGAGLLVHSGSPTIKDCVFDGNDTNASPNEGGGAWFGKDTDSTCGTTNAPVITDTVFSNNTAETGGGVFSTGSSPSYTDCEFNDNTTIGAILEGGGGMWNAGGGNVSLLRCIFDGNSTANLQLGGAIYNDSINITIDDCEFRNNSGAIGGATYDKGSIPIVTNSLFIGNTGHASTIYVEPVEATGTSKYTNCKFLGNGGDTLTWLANEPVDFVNCLFVGNSSPIVINDPEVRFIDSTIAFNTKGGIQLSDVGLEVVLINTIIWGNTDTDPNTDTFDEQILIDIGDTVTASHSDIEGWTSGGTDNIDADPEFTDADGADNTYGTEDDDLTLNSTSPCLDIDNNSGVPSGLVEDIAGNCRIENDYVDMGAYEQTCSDLCCDGFCGECCEDADCSGATPVCENTTSYTCVECTGDGHCTTSPDLTCDTSTNVCVECVDYDDCSSPTHECKPATNSCVECLIDTDCPYQFQICNYRNECVIDIE